MSCEHYFYNCSKGYVDSIDPGLYQEITGIINSLPISETQSEINRNLFFELTKKGWSYDSLPQGIKESSGKVQNFRPLCVTSSNLGANWHADFAKVFDGRLVQIEAQFGKVESMFKDFCGFRIACFERRLALGIEIVLCEPYKYFAHRKNSVGGMAYFDIANKTLPAIGLECPIWLIGIKQ
ncbi:MAG: PDDEXK family nuclease [Desulfocucumaceae bacterium]